MRQGRRAKIAIHCRSPNLVDDQNLTSTPQARVLSGSFILLAGSGLATALNFLYNVVVARFLGPTGFGHTTAAYTLLILISAITLSFQTVSAKVVAQQRSLEAKSRIYKGFHRETWMCGLLIALLLIMFREVIATYLNLPSPNLISWVACGAAFYVPLGGRRGYIQGACGFRLLASNLALEGLMRLGGSLLGLLLGFGVEGVVAANALAIVITYFSAVPKLATSSLLNEQVPVGFREGLQAIVFFVGQVAINNSDILAVKHLFLPATAGLYAAVALVGRVVYALSWAVVSTMFPIAAGARSEQRQDRGVLRTSLLLVFAISGALSLGLFLAPASIWTRLLGARFLLSGQESLPSLLALYAASTGVYSLSVVMIVYEMSRKIANTGWVQLAFSGVLVAGIYTFHSSLVQVIEVQLVLMVLLMVVVALPFLVNTLVGYGETYRTLQPGEISVIRRVLEDEVISEFLKNDFRHPEYEPYRQTVHQLVTTPNLYDANENVLRRALFQIRQGALWRELPKETQWFQVEVKPTDLQRIRVFPRAQWRKLAKQDFAITEVARAIADECSHHVAGDAFLSKINALRNGLRSYTGGSAVLLIGADEHGPFTVLDGNHRVVAAMLESTEAATGFRFFCGLSPRMIECCWYETNLATLLRYGVNMVKFLAHDAEAEFLFLLERFWSNHRPSEDAYSMPANQTAIREQIGETRNQY